MTMAEVYGKLNGMRLEYLIHKYQIYNDRFHWPTILATTENLGNILHIDYSENVSQHLKYEPKSSHFNKTQYSLHCTVKHVPGDSPYQYIYHQSD